MPEPITSNRKRADDETHGGQEPDPTFIRSSKTTGGFRRLLNYASLQFKSPSEHERHRKAERDHCDKDRQNPLGRVVSGHNRRAYLDDEPSNHCIAKPDAIHFPLFQLTEEGAHSDPGRLRSIGYSRHSVELGSGSVISLLPGPHGFESRKLHHPFHPRAR